MKKETLFDEIKTGIEQAIAYERGELEITKAVTSKTTDENSADEATNK